MSKLSGTVLHAGKGNVDSTHTASAKGARDSKFNFVSRRLSHSFCISGYIECMEDHPIFKYRLSPRWNFLDGDSGDDEKKIEARRQIVRVELCAENIAIETRDSYYVGWLLLWSDRFSEMETFLKSTLVKSLADISCLDLFNTISIENYVKKCLCVQIDKALYLECKRIMPDKVPF